MISHKFNDQFSLGITKDATDIFSNPDAKATEDAIIIAEIKASHAGKLINNIIYTPKGIRDGLASWKGAPVLRGTHDSVQVIGTVIRAEFRPSGSKEVEDKHAFNKSSGEGMGAEILWAAIYDEDSAKEIMQRRLNRVSVARSVERDNPEASTCSICSSPSIGRYICNGQNNKDADGHPQPHFYGDIYNNEESGEEKKAFAIGDSFINIHVAFLADAIAGDPLSGVLGIEEVNTSSENEEDPDTQEDSSGDVKLFSVSESGFTPSMSRDSLEEWEKESLVTIYDSYREMKPSNTSLPKESSSISTIYPTGIKNEELTEDQFQIVKGILGSKATNTAARNKLPDNAFATGSERTFPAHNKQSVQAGLAVIDSLDLPKDKKDEVYFELRRRENLYGTDKKYKMSLTDEDFEKALVIHSLVSSDCLKNESLSEDSAYRRLLKDYKDGNLPFDKLSRMKSIDGIGPGGCLPCNTEGEKYWSLKALKDGDYRGPVKSEDLIKQIEGPVDKDILSDSQRNKTQKNEEPKTMEITLDNVLKWLNEEATLGDAHKIAEASKVETAVKDKQEALVKSKTEHLEKELSETKEELQNLEAEVKDSLITATIDAKVKLGKLSNSYLVPDSAERKSEVAKLQAKGVEALKFGKEVFDELLAEVETDITTETKNKDDAGETETTTTDTVTPANTEKNPKNDPVSSKLKWS